MTVRFLHTADWQLGKPFAGVEDPHNRALLRQERLNAIARLGAAAKERGAEFILVVGDVFDSPSASKSTVSAACGAIGALGLPVFVIPGNHDHAGPGSLWGQSFFQSEREQLAPNLHVLLTPEPVELENAVLFPCPLLRRHETADLTSWLRAPEFLDDPGAFGGKPRVILAHGSVQSFGALPEADVDEEESGGGAAVNQLDLAKLPEEAFDYIALGDWHGLKQVGGKAWYPGTPEPDRFPKGDAHRMGCALAVTAERGGPPRVEVVGAGRTGWHSLAFHFAEDAPLAELEERVSALLGGRAGNDLLRLELSGALGIHDAERLERLLDTWRSRLLRLKLDNRAGIAPSPEELDALTRSADDPLISRVALALSRMAAEEGEETEIARLALRELHAFHRGETQRT